MMDPAVESLTGVSTVIIGGGILGAATLWQLSRAGMPCALFESGAFGHESTGKSAAVVRMHYSNPQVVRMALRSRDAFINLPELLGCDPVFHRTGYIFLVDANDRENAIANRQMQLAEGASSVEVSLDELEDYLPGINTEGISYVLFEEDSGFADPFATNTAYIQAARGLGAHAYEATPVEAILVQNGAVHGVSVRGRTIACDSVVLAAGAWSPALAATAGIELPIQITREQDVIYETAPEQPVPLAVSMQVDRTYLRPLPEEGDSLMLVGRGFPKPYDYVDAGGYTPEIDEELECDVRARVTARFPRLQGLRFRHGRVGLYSITPDWHPLLGPVKAVAGLHLATGGSGHCFKLAPAISELIAGEILGAPVRYADIGDFRLERFADGDVFRSTYGGNRG
jgi:sarcosine oxidase subunit beta